MTIFLSLFCIGVYQYVSPALTNQPSGTGLSEGCYPAVECDAGEDYYADACNKHVETLTGTAPSCVSLKGAAPAGQYWAFDCNSGCYLRSTPQPATCPGGVMINEKCYTLLNIVDANGIAKIWNGTIFTRPVSIPDIDCAVGNTSVWNGSSWQCGDVSKWTSSGNNIYYNKGNVGVGILNPGAKLDVGSIFIKNLANCARISSNNLGTLYCSS